MKKILLTLLLSKMALASSVKLNFNSHSGTGCPQGTVAAIENNEGDTLSILFDEFTAEVPQVDGNNDNHEIPGISRYTTSISHKNCLLALDAVLKEGYKVDSIQISIDSRGVTALDPGLIGRFMTQLESYQGLASYARRAGRGFLVGRKMWRASSSGVDEDWTLSSDINIPVNSRCALNGSEKLSLKLKSHMMLMNKTGNEDLSGYMALDSSDITSALKFKIFVSSCRKASVKVPRRGSGRTRRSRGARTRRGARTQRSRRNRL